MKKNPGVKAWLSEEQWEATKKKISASMKERYRRERLRFKWGLPQKTCMRVALRRDKQAEHKRHYLRSKGYVIERGSKIAYITPDTTRSALVERRAHGIGFRFIEQSEIDVLADEYRALRKVKNKIEEGKL